ncbi:LysR family transcriptional regulator [Mycetocola sp. 2940]|uniref:LysR family transcriptional regulator n=1 Tax=Mycetocola sp. 2940 TaxID=3156452 RepID=UPI00339997C8
MALELSALRLLVACVGQGTITDAAIERGLSQAAASRGIAALEAELGTRLLRRGPRGVVPTPAGNRVVVQARRVLAEVDAVRTVVGSDGRTLRVGYAWAAFGAHTDGIRKRWAAEHPATRLELVHVNTRTAGLAEGIVDIAVLRVPVDARFLAVELGRERRFAAVPADDALARRRSLRLSDLEGRVVVTDPETSTTTASLWADGAVTIRHIRDMEEWLDEIATGGAVGTTAEATVARHPRRGVAYRLVRDAPLIPVTLAWWRDDEARDARSLVDIAREFYDTASTRPA